MLTQVAINAAKPKDKPYKLTDGRGLFLLIETNGSKVWRFRYKLRGREPSRRTPPLRSIRRARRTGSTRASR